MAELSRLLAEKGIIDPRQAVLSPLSGGVSCDVVKVECGDGRVFVVKRALAKLKVKDDWFADVGRNRYEHLYMECVGEFLPDAVPRVLRADDDRGFFCMDWLGEGWNNWKQCLLQGECRIGDAREAGRILGAIHRRTGGDETLKKRFDTTKNFFELRLEPYLLTTGARHPGLRPLFEEEAQRIAGTRECLVHGDFSPKNLLVKEGRVVVLDCEVAWYGDPSFDVAFLLNHLHLKALHHAPRKTDLQAMIAAFAGAYFAGRGLDARNVSKMGRTVGRLLLMLMLARVDGKSPVEYLAGHSRKQDFIRQFAPGHLRRADSEGLESITADWFQSLESLSP